MARAIGIILILLGAVAVALPFVGPLFNFGMGPDPAWIVTEARVVRHVIPGAAIILGGILLLPRARPSHVLGGLLAVAGGLWLTVAPVVLGRVTADAPPALVDVLRPLLYHFATGAVIVAFAAYALGVATGHARTRPVDRHAAVEPERESVGASRS